MLWYVSPRYFILFRRDHAIVSSAIIEEVRDVCQTELSTLAFFYFDFRDGAKQDARSLLSSLLVQLSNRSDNFCKILSEFYSAHNRGSQQPSEDALMECLKDMLTLSGQGDIYIVVDALDECPNSSGCPTPREDVLRIMEFLVGLRHPHLRFCVTSRPEVDIRDVLEVLAVHMAHFMSKPDRIKMFPSISNHLFPRTGRCGD